MAAFPSNVIEVFQTYLPNLIGGEVPEVVDDLEFVARPVQMTDPNPTIGAYSTDWVPDEHEIGQFQPALTHYLFLIQTLVKHTEEEEARALHSTITTALRINLFNNEILKDALTTLNHEALGQKERAQSYGVGRVRYYNNMLNGEFTFLSNIDFYLRVESVPV